MNKDPGTRAVPEATEPHLTTLKPPERVLATLNADGSRRWLKPRISPGRFLTARRAVAYGLIALFALLPYLTINGKPAILLDVLHRRFTFFGRTFLATDTALLAVLMLIIFLTVFLVTALFGRIWCGWACPQTVYMEFLFRPIERLLEGAPGTRRASQPTGPVRKIVKYALFLACSLFLAHIFLAYFVGIEALRTWVTRSPAEHPTGFLVVVITTALMMFDFAFFREQTCLVACPYGRLQSAMLDRHTLVISYDRKRGEPRGRIRSGSKDRTVSLPVAETPPRGDCVDCLKCVTTCPTGIDIRDGLQMECIGCAQCIDACDSVMDALGRKRGLIGYSSRAILDGESRTIIRPRIILYPMLLAGLVGLFAYMLVNKPVVEAAVLPRQGAPFYTLPSGAVANQVRLRIVNRGDRPGEYTIAVAESDREAGISLDLAHNPVTVGAGESASIGFIIEAPVDAFSARGSYEATITIGGGSGVNLALPYRILGPVNRASPREKAP